LFNIVFPQSVLYGNFLAYWKQNELKDDMIRVLGLALYGPLAASHRVRLAQYRKDLLKEGIDLEVHSLLGNDYLQSRFQGGRTPIFSVLNSGFERLRLLLGARRFDAAVVHCEAFPLVPGWLERTVFRVPYIYDFDDAFYLRYQNGNLGALRFLLGRKFDTVMRGAASITAGNATLAAYARRLNNKVSLLPSVVDTAYFFPRAQNNSIFTIGWIGSPSTSIYLQNLIAPLRKLSQERPFRLVVIGGKAPHIENLEVIELPWSEDSEVNLINMFDVGVMPLPNDEWARGKCAYKLIQYMACGLPVVASKVGANVEVVTPDCGFLVERSADWVDALRKLHDQPELRRQMGAAGRRRIEEQYSLRRNVPLMAEVIRGVVGKA
jgi:glycosyltransferase involved in cell wall biosynthesis